MLVGGIYRGGILLFALIMAADQVGINVGAALAGIGVTGIALGFAAKDTLANWIAGFLIFWDKPFEVGDWVTVADQYGKVLQITMRSTRIRTNQNTWVVIPNQHIIDQVLVNHSKHGETRIDVPVGIAYKEDILRARDVILAAVTPLPDVLAEPAADVVVKSLGSSSVDLLVRVWIDDAGREQPVYFAVMETSKRSLDAAGIEIPFHHLQLFVEDVRDPVWEKAAGLLAR
jgi:small-conductance mechanosensitive channel